MTDSDKVRREGMRWHLLSALHKASPYTTSETHLLDWMHSIYPDASALEVRKQLEYLADRELIGVKKEPSGAWFADIGRYGTDVVEYTVACEPGIARPVKYWEN